MSSKLVSAVWLALLLALLPSRARGAGPDDDYLAIFEQLQAADQTAARADPDGARAAYLEVQARLMAFREAYPTWHPEIIEFRLRYVRQRLVALGPDTTGELAGVPAESKEPPNPETVRIQLLEGRLRQLEFEREELRARLREALAPTPSEGDSPELRRAEERIRQQQKEIDLLRYALAARGDTDLPAPDGLGVPGPHDVQDQMAALQKELELEKARRSALELVAAGLQDRLRTVQAAGVDVAPADAGPGLKPSEVAPVPDALVLGRELLAAGRIDEALPVLSGAAQSAPESTDALTLLGRVFASKGLPDAAEAVLQRALRIDPKCGAAHFELTRVHLGRTPPELAAARLHYQAARQLGVPADPGLEASMADAARQPAGQVR